ncbi:hypothetical protein B0T14DRAFT_499282 [Immersiella caudata]|uniref:BTB domain-containing protein n=1 Tax=Immersiella caudata TaxID=314043 RepID=A0AA39WEG4_9PEZI|nr:hypothetical protein B0T14DRAFT_499282 [Immersiella caudata]
MSGESDKTADSTRASGEAEISILNRRFSGRMVKIIVGPERRKWAIHENMLCPISDFFVAALTGPFKEREGVIELPEEEVKAFDLFATWIYRPVWEARDLPAIEADDNLRNYLALYVMSAKFLVNELEVEASGAIYRYYTLKNDTKINEAIKPKAEYVHYLFHNTMERAGLRRFFCDLIIVHCKGKEHPSKKDIEHWQTFTDDRADIGSQLMQSVCEYISGNNLSSLLKQKRLGEFREYK